MPSFHITTAWLKEPSEDSKTNPITLEFMLDRRISATKMFGWQLPGFFANQDAGQLPLARR
jgi:hypothetical protein